VTSGGQQSIRVVESAMSLELLLEFIQHEDEETRIIILKLLDVFLRNPTNRTQFFQMKYLRPFFHSLHSYSTHNRLAVRREEF